MNKGKGILSKFKKFVNQDSKKTESYSVNSFSSAIETPVIKEVKSKDYVLYGEDNLFPNKIKDLKVGSAIHNAILKTKAKMTAGDGFLLNGAKNLDESKVVYDSLPADVKEDYDLTIENRNDKSLEKIKKLNSKDLQEFGAFAYELIWNGEFTRIATVKHVDVSNLRSGKFVDGKIKSYWYSRNWADLRNYPAKEIFTFDPNDKTHLNQIVYEKIGSNEYYGEPSYIGGLTWVQIDFQMGIYHLSNITNGMAPSMALNFFKVPKSEEERQGILNNITKNFIGPSKTGKHMVFFSENKDLAPTINAIQTSNLDKQLIHLSELCDRKILTAHQLTSPLLVGISTSGQIGGNTELEKAYKIFDNVVIASDRSEISDSYQRNIFDVNKIPVTIKINPFNPFV